MLGSSLASRVLYGVQALQYSFHLRSEHTDIFSNIPDMEFNKRNIEQILSESDLA